MSCPEIGLHNFANLNGTKMEQITKEKIIAEYLAGGISFRKLQAKYGVNFRNIQRWVQQYKGNYTSSNKSGKSSTNEIHEAKENLPKEVKQLQVELSQARLHNQLLEALLDIGKEQYGVDLRKKAGTKRS